MITIRKPEITSLKDNLIIPKRGNDVNLFIGVNKTGKSSTAREIVEAWKASRPDPKFKVIAHDPQKIFGEIRDPKTGRILKPNLVDLHIEPDDEDWALRLCEMRNCYIIMDEFGVLNDKNVPVKGLKKLLYFREYWNHESMVLIHNPSLMLNILAGYATRYFIFLTFTQEGSFKKKIPNYRYCMAAASEVNEYVKKYGKGKHKLDPEYDGQGFPHIIFDVATQKLYAINMEKEFSNKLSEFIPRK